MTDTKRSQALILNLMPLLQDLMLKPPCGNTAPLDTSLSSHLSSDRTALTAVELMVKRAYAIIYIEQLSRVLNPHTVGFYATVHQHCHVIVRLHPAKKCFQDSLRIALAFLSLYLRKSDFQCRSESAPTGCISRRSSAGFQHVIR